MQCPETHLEVRLSLSLPADTDRTAQRLSHLELTLPYTSVLVSQLLLCRRQGLRTMLILNSRSFCHARVTGTGYRLALAPQVLPVAW